MNYLYDKLKLKILTASTAVLARLVLKKDVIKRILQSNTMRKSVIYQDILQEGLAQGIEQKAQEIAIKMINKGIDIETIVNVTGLTIE